MEKGYKEKQEKQKIVSDRLASRLKINQSNSSN